MPSDEYQFLSADTIAQLDAGAIGIAFNEYLREIVRDCQDRPADDRKRSLLVQFDFMPVKRIEGTTIDCDGVRAKGIVRRKLPDKESPVLDFGVKANGSLYFRPDSPANHRQTTMLGE